MQFKVGDICMTRRREKRLPDGTFYGLETPWKDALVRVIEVPESPRGTYCVEFVTPVGLDEIPTGNQQFLVHPEELEALSRVRVAAKAAIEASPDGRPYNQDITALRDALAACDEYEQNVFGQKK